MPREELSEAAQVFLCVMGTVGVVAAVGIGSCHYNDAKITTTAMEQGYEQKVVPGTPRASYRIWVKSDSKSFNSKLPEAQ